MILTPDQIKHRLKQLGVRPDKYLGQHFLINQAVLDTIWEESQKFVCSCDTIVEVGPGLGVLTHDLLNHEGAPIIAIERDPVFANALADFLQAPDQVQVVKGDVLDVLDRNPGFPFSGQVVTGVGEQALRNPAHEACEQHQQSPGWVVIANIPYAITSPLLRKLVNREHAPHHILVLVQKEAAERIVAKPGDRNRGLLTVQIEVMATARIILEVPPSSFWPAPEVDSALLLLETRAEPLVKPEDMKHFFRVVIAGFSAKRKKLANSIAGGMATSVDAARLSLAQSGIDLDRRAETLSVEEWIRLAAALQEIE